MNIDRSMWGTPIEALSEDEDDDEYEDYDDYHQYQEKTFDLASEITQAPSETNGIETPEIDIRK